LSNKDWKQSAIVLANTGAMSWRDISRTLKVGKSTVSDYLRKYYKDLYKEAEPIVYSIPKTARILLFDLETAPTTAYIWGRFDQTVAQKQVVKEGYILTYSAKWLGEDTIISNRITTQYDDSGLVKELAELFDQADIVVAHNAIRFDVPLLKTRMIALGLQPPLPSKIVDTLRIAKAEFRFPSNSLDNIAAYLGLPRKMSHSGFELWTRCMAMEDEAFEEMLEYNVQDVVVLEQLYLRLRHWSKTHPNIALLEPSGVARCVCCGSTDLKNVNKLFHTTTASYEMVSCGDCGKVNRKRKNVSVHGKELLTNTGK
jgi:hypothetical protein